MSQFVTVAKVGDIPNGEGRAFEFNDRMIAIFNHDGEYCAIDDQCPHAGESLAEGYFDPDNCVVTCAFHAWRFNAKDGSWCDNPRIKIDTFDVRVSGDEIQVAEKVPEPDPPEPDHPIEPNSGADGTISHPAEESPLD